MVVMVMPAAMETTRCSLVTLSFTCTHMHMHMHMHMHQKERARSQRPGILYARRRFLFLFFRDGGNTAVRHGPRGREHGTFPSKK